MARSQMSYNYQETIGQAGENFLQGNKFLADKSTYPINLFEPHFRSFVKRRGSAGGARPLGEAAKCIQVAGFFNQISNTANYDFHFQEQAGSCGK